MKPVFLIRLIRRAFLVCVGIAVVGVGDQPTTYAAPLNTAKENTANLWVDLNGGECRRMRIVSSFDAGRACQDLAAAQASARPGDLVRVRGGSYPIQRFVQFKQIVVRSAVGERPVYEELIFEPGSGNVRMIGAVAAMLRVGQADDGVPVRDLVFEGLDVNSFVIDLAERVTVRGGDVGPQFASSPVIGVLNPWNTYRPTDIVFDRVRFHDARTNADGNPHTECLLIYAARRVTVRNSVFDNCDSTGALFVSMLNAYGFQSGVEQVLIENNRFLAGGNQHWHVQVQADAEVTFRRNVWLKGVLIAPPNASLGYAAKPVRFVENIGERPTVQGETQCTVSQWRLMFARNAFTRGRCDRSDRLLATRRLVCWAAALPSLPDPTLVAPARPRISC